MLKNIIHFIKYNNATVLILVFIFLLTGGVFASTDVGQEIIGGEEVSVEGVDNSFLLEIVLDDFNMDFRIEKIEEDSDFYYIIYTYLDLAEVNAAWQPLVVEKVRKVSKKSLLLGKADLGVYLAEELHEEYEARMKELKEEQAEAMEDGEETRIEIVEYGGLIGNTLDLAARIFPGYEPVTTRELPSPVFTDVVYESTPEYSAPEDNFVEIYEEYVVELEDTSSVIPAEAGIQSETETDEEEGLDSGSEAGMTGEDVEDVATTTPEEIIEEVVEEEVVEEEVIEEEVIEEEVIEEEVIEEEVIEEEVEEEEL